MKNIYFFALLYLCIPSISYAEIICYGSNNGWQTACKASVKKVCDKAISDPLVGNIGSPAGAGANLRDACQVGTAPEIIVRESGNNKLERSGHAGFGSFCEASSLRERFLKAFGVGPSCRQVWQFYITRKWNGCGGIETTYVHELSHVLRGYNRQLGIEVLPGPPSCQGHGGDESAAVRSENIYRAACGLCCMRTAYAGECPVADPLPPNFSPFRATITYGVGNDVMTLDETGSTSDSYSNADTKRDRDSLLFGELNGSLTISNSSVNMNIDLSSTSGPGFSFYEPNYRASTEVLFGYNYDVTSKQELLLEATDGINTPGYWTRKGTSNRTQTWVSGVWDDVVESAIAPFQTGETVTFDKTRNESYSGIVGELNDCRYTKASDIIDRHLQKSWNLGSSSHSTITSVMVTATPSENTD